MNESCTPTNCLLLLCFSILLPAVSKVLHSMQIKYICELLRLFKHTEANKTPLLSHITESILIIFPSLEISDGTSVSHIKSKQNYVCIWCDRKLQGTQGPCHREYVLPVLVLVSDCGQIVLLSTSLVLYMAPRCWMHWAFHCYQCLRSSRNILRELFAHEHFTCGMFYVSKIQGWYETVNEHNWHLEQTGIPMLAFWCAQVATSKCQFAWCL